MAEVSTSTAACVVNLTYGAKDDLSDKVIHPKHFQLFIKRLRRAGHKVRYFVAGEYGELKSRAHFHAVLFFEHLVPLAYADPANGQWIVRGQTPLYKDDYQLGTQPEDWGPFCSEIPQKRMVHIREWPHGHVTTDWSVSERSVRYVCKYLLAEDKNNAWFSLSKKPALGAAFFADKAAQAREYSVLPSRFDYLPPGGDKRRSYLMTGASRRDYLNAITQDPERKASMSEWTEKTFEKLERQRWLEELEAIAMLDPDGVDEAIAERKEDYRRIKFLEKQKEMEDAINRSASGEIIETLEGKWITIEESILKRSKIHGKSNAPHLAPVS